MSDLSVADTFLHGPPPTKADVSDEEFTSLVWAFRGILKEQERERTFWAATNDNLTDAFLELEKKDRELEAAYDLINEDLQLASNVQASLLPTLPTPMVDELEAAVFHRQLAAVGGDYYDYFPLESGRYAIGVFDISGHGVAAALVMTFLKAQFMTAMKEGVSPARTVERVNETASAFLRGARKYATVNFVSFASDYLTYVNGGGNGLVVGHAGSLEFEKRDQYLGLRTCPYHEHRIPFAAGDLLALYTDGIYEVQDESGRDYTKRRLNRLIVAHSAKPLDQLVEICREDYEQFRASDSDDVTLLLVRRRGPDDN